MDWLYRIYYTILSLGILMILIFPAVVVFRFLLRKIPKKYTVWGWWIFFLRSICPIALSSALCVVPSWNRQYHRFLSGLGLTIQDQSGIMRSWIAVFRYDITASDTFKICSIIWAAGLIGVLLLGIINYQKLQKELQAAKVIGENIYESAALSEPVRLGFFSERLYLPQGFQTKEMIWLLRHMEYHQGEGLKRLLLLVIMSCHWFNPVMWLYYYWWGLDAEMAADDKTVYKKNKAERKEYAQEIMNFVKESGGKQSRLIIRGLFFLGVTEKNIEKRAYRMMYQKENTVNDKLLGILLLSLSVIFCFLLRPMQIAWSGGTWGSSTPSKEEDLFQTKDAVIVAKMKTTSPEGLERVIQLEMADGEESQDGYDGTFVIRMYDVMENEIASCRAEEIFTGVEKGSVHFSKNVTLCISDYNGDNVQELVIGQQGTPQAEETPDRELQQDEELYSYALVNIEDKKLTVICQDINVIDNKNNMSESVSFEKPEGISDIFAVPYGEDTYYYVWNTGSRTYEKRTMSEEDLENHRRNADAQASDGETKEHTLEDSSGTAAVLVTAKQDSTQSEVIQSVTLSPRRNSKRFDDIHGYYCDLLWVDSGSEKNRYAQLIYNGTKAQTFVIYDTKRKNVYYQHEDGPGPLANVFALYRVDDITFNEGGAVVYELADKKDDVLRIKFVAEADNNITVNGSYEYNTVRKIASNFSFSRSSDDGAQTAAPET